MAGTFFRFFIKNLLRQKLISCINILGLSAGLTIFLLLALYVEDEFSWDRHWPDADQLARLNLMSLSGGTVSNVFPLAPPVLQAHLEQNFPEAIESATLQVNLRPQELMVAGERVEGTVFLVDEDFPDFFPLEVLRGSLETTLDAPYRLAISEEDALRWFGGLDVLGERLTVTLSGGGQQDFEVSAVFRAPGENSNVDIFNFSLLHPSAEFGLADALTSWRNVTGAFHYYRLAEGADVESLNARIDGIVDSHGVIGEGNQEDKPSARTRYRLQKLEDARIEPTALDTGADLQRLRMFASIAVLVLLVGTVNFLTLSTAQGMDRKREIGVKKTAGAGNGELLAQFLGESLLTAAVAMVLALILVELALPAFSALTAHELEFDYGRWEMIGFLVLVTLLVGLGGGFYPALVLSRLRPDKVLRAGDGIAAPGSGKLRNLLTGFQFLTASALILATLTLSLQLAWMSRQDPGYNPRNTASIFINYVSLDNNTFDTLANAIRSLPGVQRATVGSRHPNEISLERQNRYPFARAQEDAARVEFITLSIGHDFLPLYEIPLLAGRNFDPRLETAFPYDQPSNDRRAGLFGAKVLLNLSGVRALGFQFPADAVGQIIYQVSTRLDGNARYTPLEVIGVMVDNQFLSRRDAPFPTVYQPPFVRGNVSSIQVRLEEGYETAFREEALRLWNGIVGEERTYIEFTEATMTNAFAPERNEGRLLTGFSLLALLVSCAGLYGVVMFELRRRTKEIGIRKALGAETRGIVALFLGRFSRPALAGSLLAWPLTLYVLLQWLERFPYQMERLWLLPLCLAAGALVMLVACLTIAGASAKAAAAPPVQALRYE